MVKLPELREYMRDRATDDRASIDQESAQPPKGTRHLVLERDILGRNDVNRGVNLSCIAALSG